MLPKKVVCFYSSAFRGSDFSGSNEVAAQAGKKKRLPPCKVLLIVSYPSLEKFGSQYTGPNRTELYSSDDV